MRRRQGFTLIEALAALAVLALLATLAVPSFASHLARHRLKAAAETLAADLAEARHEAALRGAPLYLALRGGSDWCWAVARSPGCDCGTPQPCALKTVTAADTPGVTLEGHADAALDPAGGAGPLSVQLAGRDGGRLRVEVTPLGRARVCAPDGWQGYPRCGG